MPSVLLIEDHALMRARLRRWLPERAEPMFETGTEASACDAAPHPDGVRMDIELSGQDATARVLIVTSYDAVELQRAAAVAGARGYLRKENLWELRQWRKPP